LAVVHLAVLGIEDRATDPFPALGLHATDDLQPHDLAALAVIGAFLAGLVQLRLVVQVHDATGGHAVLHGDLHHAAWLPGVVVDGGPTACDVLRVHQGGERDRKDGGERAHAHGLSGSEAAAHGHDVAEGE